MNAFNFLNQESIFSELKPNSISPTNESLIMETITPASSISSSPSLILEKLDDQNINQTIVSNNQEVKCVEAFSL